MKEVSKDEKEIRGGNGVEGKSIHQNKFLLIKYRHSRYSG